MKNNIESEVINDFGLEWSKFNYKNIKFSSKPPYWVAVGTKI